MFNLANHTHIKSTHKTYSFIKSNYIFILFFLINISLYIFIFLFSKSVPFNRFNYINNAHHFIKDPRIVGKSPSFFNLLAQFDAQWYLKIAKDGYPKNPKTISMVDKSKMDGLTYAFFPLYPAIVYVFNKMFNNIEMSAFFVSHLFLFLDVVLLYFSVKKWYGKDVAVKSLFLFFFFPFSIFFRSYFTESLLLFLLLLFSRFIIEKKYFYATLCMSLLSITKGNVLFLNLYLLYILIKDKKYTRSLKFLMFFILTLPFFLWILFNYIQTGNLLYFLSVRSQWYFTATNPSPLLWPIIFPLTFFTRILNFTSLALHSFHSSKIDVIIFIFTLVLLMQKQKIHIKLWIISFLLFLNIIFSTDTVSFSRHIIISPFLFIIMAKILKGVSYYATLGLFILFYFIVSLYFVNSYWIG